MPQFTAAEKAELYADSLFGLVILNLILLVFQFLFFPLFWTWIWSFQVVINALILYGLIKKIKIQNGKNLWALINRK